MSECNKMIKLMLDGKIEVSSNLFGIFCLFANRIVDLNQVLRIAEAENINLVEVCRKNNLDFKKIAMQQ